MVSARAGSGKTQLIADIYKMLCPNLFSDSTNRVIVLTYNTEARGELQCRGIRDAFTFHAFGRRAYLNHLRCSDPESDICLVKEPVTDYFKLMLKDNEKNKYAGGLKLIAIRVIAEIKRDGYGCPDIGDITFPLLNDETIAILTECHYQSSKEKLNEPLLLKNYGTIAQALIALNTLIKEVLHFSLERCGGGNMAYDDMLYMGLRLDVCLLDLCRYVSFLMVDEAQDMSKVRRAWVTKILLATKKLRGVPARFLFVGDRCQAIYGFAGAEFDAMEKLNQQLNANVFTLTTTFRCPQSHVELANTVLDDMGRDDVPMKCPFTAIEGEILYEQDFRLFFTPDGQVNEARCYNDVAILSRRNAPLLALRGALMSRGVRCNMLGRKDLGARLMDVVNDLKASSIEQFEYKLSAYCRKKGKLPLYFSMNELLFICLITQLLFTHYTIVLSVLFIHNNIFFNVTSGRVKPMLYISLF